MGRSRERIKKGRKRFLRKARPFILSAGALLTLWWYFSIPSTLFQVPYATVTESADGRLLGARIANDGQWRFPPLDSVPHRFKACIIAFEDEGFAWHPGVDPTAIARAIRQNITAGEVVSGGSTISMQVIRLSRNNPNRTYFEKITEMLRATRLEAEYTKDEILAMYASHAPFGGNVVGLEAASWRYYQRPPHLLSWAECASLAVLPNDPSEVRPDRNRDRYLEKRNFLLDKLLEEGKIDSTTYRLSIREGLPAEPYALPDLTHHLTERQNRERRGTRIKTAVDYNLQILVQQLIDAQASKWRPNEVHNSAALVMELSTGRLVSYVGNTVNPASDAFEVDMLNRPRNTGSILKPFLYAEAMRQGRITSQSLIVDIPTRIGDFTPANFDESYRGAVTVTEALQQSLNIPAVRLLRDMSLPSFVSHLQSLGIEDLNRSADYYGLSLILGGSEVRPLQMATAYRNWILNERQNDSVYNVWNERNANPYNDAGGSWYTHEVLEIMEGLNRPERWKRFGAYSNRRIAWKTGTSFGFRDAWTVGTDGQWLVVVWTGNASNEGRPGVIGTETSSPLLFEIMTHLPEGEFSDRPVAFQEVKICSKSGYKAQLHCSSTHTTQLPISEIQRCEFCERIYINDAGERVTPNCSTTPARDTTWMILPPAMAWYAQSSGEDYTPAPDWAASCAGESTLQVQWIYPDQNGEVVELTRDFDGELGPVILEAGHHSSDARIYWSVDGEYMGETRTDHKLSVFLRPGTHQLTITDEHGNSSTLSVVVVD